MTSHRSKPHRAVAWLFVVLLPIFIVGPAFAQEANASEDRWAAQAEFTLTATSGNQEMTVLTTGFGLRHLRKELFDLDLKLQARYGSSEGEHVAENYRGTVNVDIGPQRRWSPFVYSTAEHDPFKRLDVRVSSGAGAKYRLYRSDHGDQASLSVAMLHSYEALAPALNAEPGNEDFGSRTTDARWSLRLNGQRKLRDGVTLTSEALYEPVVDHASDYLLSVDTGLKVLVTQRIALSIAHEFNQDSTPPPGVEEIDRLLRAGILIEL